MVDLPLHGATDGFRIGVSSLSRDGVSQEKGQEGAATKLPAPFISLWTSMEAIVEEEKKKKEKKKCPREADGKKANNKSRMR